MLSIVIPAFNAEKTLTGLLDSINRSDFKDYEVIVADDLSIDKTAFLLKDYRVKAVFLTAHSGPAVARNKGAEIARGEILVFLDADTEVEPDTLGKIARRFKENQDVKVLVGTYSERPLSKGWFPRFKALWFKSLLMGDGTKTDSLEGFCVAIDRRVFKSAGGFNPSFQAGGMEDYELGCRLRRRYQLYFDSGIQVRHHFPGFLKNWFKFFSRAYNFTPLFLAQDKSLRGRYLNRDAAAAVSSFASFLSLPFMAMHFPLSGFAFAVFIIIFIFSSARFVKLVLQKEGLFFAVFSTAVYYANGIVLGLAMALGALRYALTPGKSAK